MADKNFRTRGDVATRLPVWCCHEVSIYVLYLYT